MEYNKKIDGYGILEFGNGEIASNGRELKNIVITYISNIEVFANSFQYKNVTEEKVKEIKDVISDFTSYNFKVDICSAIPLITIINEVERIIYNKK